MGAGEESRAGTTRGVTPWGPGQSIATSGFHIRQSPSNAFEFGRIIFICRGHVAAAAAITKAFRGQDREQQDRQARPQPQMVVAGAGSALAISANNRARVHKLASSRDERLPSAIPTTATPNPPRCYTSSAAMMFSRRPRFFFSVTLRRKSGTHLPRAEESSRPSLHAPFWLSKIVAVGTHSVLANGLLPSPKPFLAASPHTRPSRLDSVLLASFLGLFYREASNTKCLMLHSKNAESSIFRVPLQYSVGHWCPVALTPVSGRTC
jgi:hypothetical protein